MAGGNGPATPGQAAPEPWRATWMAFIDAAGFEKRPLAEGDELDPQWRASWEAAAKAGHAAIAARDDAPEPELELW